MTDTEITARPSAPPAGAGMQALLLLADGRLPAGGYAHSGGLESAVRLGKVTDLTDLARFLTGRAFTGGAVSAAFAAAACRACLDDDVARVARLDAEYRARTPSPALRAVSQSLGRQLMRALTAIAPHPLQARLPQRLDHPIAFGAAAAMLGMQPLEAARGILHETVTGPAMAVVKLMSVDPFHAHRVLADLLGPLDEIAVAAAAEATADPADLPAYSAPLSDVVAEHHAAQGVRLFAS
ncbi:urease accessory protein UreF [Gordonia aichiensis]|uniref:urease accessory protein UreF n=1 Tax=Gordonia aichiensis TaxID=36820 RepID=UPI003263C586